MLPSRTMRGQGCISLVVCLAALSGVAVAVLGACASAPVRTELGDARPVVEDAAARPAEALAAEALHLNGTDERLTRLSRLDVVLARSFAKVIAGLPDDARPSEEELRALNARLASIVRVAFDADRLVSRSARALGELERPPVHLGESLAFFRSELHRKMAFARADAETPSGQRRLASYLSRLPPEPADPIRSDVVRRLVEASGEKELFFRLSFEVPKRFLEATEGAFPPWAKGAYVAFRAQSSSGEEAFRAQITRSLVLQATYAYRKLSRAELEEALAFWQSDAGQWYARGRLVAVTHALEEAYARALRGVNPPSDPARGPHAARP